MSKKKMVSEKIIYLLLVFNIFDFTQSRAVAVSPYFYTEGIHTQWPERKKVEISNLKDKTENDDPGFMKRQLLKFGEIASKLGNSVGSGAFTLSKAIDKICEVVKTVIALLTAVCHVGGQFKFCAASVGAPEAINEAFSSDYKDLNLNIPD